jgi:lipoprotein-anchoring transpeptidase ErfK/SrfK
MKCLRTGVLFGTILAVSLGLMLTAFVEDGNADPRKAILVNVDQQVLYAVDNYKIIYEFDVITGQPGKETTAGKFSIFKKIEDYTSKKYKAPMPYTMFFSKDGKAVHGTKWATLRSYLHAYVSESVGSMGCVGLTEDDARTLFEWAPVGTAIVILDEATEE